MLELIGGACFALTVIAVALFAVARRDRKRDRERRLADARAILAERAAFHRKMTGRAARDGD